MAEWTAGICNEKAGFLFSHACDRAPESSCMLCDRPVCGDHSHPVDEGVVCTTCRRQRYSRRGRRRRQREDFDDDPYFYGYGGYGYGGYYRDEYDGNDFTEADGASLLHSGDEDFENDMTES